MQKSGSMHVKIPASNTNAWTNNLHKWFFSKGAPEFFEVVKLLAPVSKEGNKLELVFKDNQSFNELDTHISRLKAHGAHGQHIRQAYISLARKRYFDSPQKLKYLSYSRN